MNLLGKIAKPSRDSVLEFWISETSFFERDSVFLHLYLQEGRLYNLLIILKQNRGGICMTDRNHKKILWL